MRFHGPGWEPQAEREFGPFPAVRHRDLGGNQNLVGIVAVRKLTINFTGPSTDEANRDPIYSIPDEPAGRRPGGFRVLVVTVGRPLIPWAPASAGRSCKYNDRNWPPRRRKMDSYRFPTSLKVCQAMAIPRSWTRRRPDLKTAYSSLDAGVVVLQTGVLENLGRQAP